MLNKRVTIAYADLNASYAGDTIEVDPSMEFTVSPIAGEVTKTVYPIGIQIINDTGAEIEYNAVTSVEEYNMYSDTNPPVLQRLQKSGTLTTDYTNFPKCCELPKAKASGLLASTSLLFSKFKRIFKKSYILSTSVNSLCTTGTKLKKFYDRKVFSICQLPTFKKFQRTNLVISTLKLKSVFVKTILNFLKNKFALYPKSKDLGFTACIHKFLIKAREATASSDLIIEFINYRY